MTEANSKVTFSFNGEGFELVIPIKKIASLKFGPFSFGEVIMV